MHLLLATPRGFCAGVIRAIQMVEAALRLHGAPVYVRHEIVHNKFVVESLKAKGAIFVKELSEIPPETKQPVIYSAHGVSKAVIAEGEARGFYAVEATCPLVSKVHTSAQMLHRQGNHIVVVGHQGHPEMVGTIGQLPEGACTLIETVEDAQTMPLPEGPLALTTQTTLSVDETADIIAALVTRFPNLKQPKKEDICYATTNRQAAVKAIAPRAQLMIVVGAPHSSNTVRLKETSLQAGCPEAILIQRATELDNLAINWEAITTVGLTGGASCPELLIEEVITWLKQRFTVTTEEVLTVEEDYNFRLPLTLQAGNPDNLPPLAN